MKVDTRNQVAESDINRRIVRRLLSSVGSPRISMRLWNGEEYFFGSGSPVGCMEVRDWRALVGMLLRATVGFGEGYSRGQIEIHGDFLSFINEITRAIAVGREGNYLSQKLRSQFRGLRNNTLSRSRHNVHHHYDLGNDFYKLWLDENLVYTCAYYDHPASTLAEAQIAKLDHVCRKVQLQPGQKVIEAGCGWGALAMHMAEHYGVTVKAYNNSHEQVKYAREQAEARGLTGRVEFVEADYRTIDERCDAFVSVGMLEHVGLRNYRTLGELMGRCLKPDGLGIIHTIGRSHPGPTDPWITKYIFPGGHIPSLSEIMSVIEPGMFSVLDVENLRLHYARTCRAWLDNFEAVSDQVADMYDEEFVRTWRLYLAGSSAGFQSGTLQLFQVVFAPFGNNDVPWNRRHLYPPDPVRAPSSSA